MSEDKIVNNGQITEEISIEEILNACARKDPNSESEGVFEEGAKVFHKYFNPDHPILNIDKPIKYQWNALAFSTYFGKVKEVRELIRLGANLNAPLDKNMNVLHMAATRGKEDLCILFLNNGININARCDHGRTALMRACEAGHLDVVKVLMQFKPDIMIKDNDNKSCIEYARENQSYDIIRFINNFYLNSTLSTKSEGDLPVKRFSKV